MATADSLLSRIERFLDASGQSATAFGKATVGDPNLVRDLRGGREPKRRLVEKIETYIAAATSDAPPTAPDTPSPNPAEVQS